MDELKGFIIKDFLDPEAFVERFVCSDLSNFPFSRERDSFFTLEQFI